MFFDNPQIKASLKRIGEPKIVGRGGKPLRLTGRSVADMEALVNENCVCGLAMHPNPDTGLPECARCDATPTPIKVVYV